MKQPFEGSSWGEDATAPAGAWCDALRASPAGNAFALGKLYERNRTYFRARIPNLLHVPGECRWEGECPFCPGRLEIEILSGWWVCGGCARGGDALVLEFLIFGRGESANWARCCERVAILMRGAAEVEPAAC